MGLLSVEGGQAGGQELTELAVAPLALVEALESVRELRVVRLERRQRFQVLNRAVGAIGEVLCGLGRVFEERDARAVVGVRERAIVEREELVPALGGVEEQLEPVERPVGARVEREHPLEHAHDPRRILEPLLAELHGALAEGPRLILCQGRERTSS